MIVSMIDRACKLSSGNLASPLGVSRLVGITGLIGHNNTSGFGMLAFVFTASPSLSLLHLHFHCFTFTFTCSPSPSLVHLHFHSVIFTFTFGVPGDYHGYPKPVVFRVTGTVCTLATSQHTAYPYRSIAGMHKLNILKVSFNNLLLDNFTTRQKNSNGA
jgi:hypothetical protein